MKRNYGIILGLLLSLISKDALSETYAIEQVHGQPITDTPNDPKLINRPNNEYPQAQDYQKSILSNKDISDIARTKAITGNGGNTATIIQNGNNNHSDVTQSGNGNYSNQTQTGDVNNISLKQEGNDNHSNEKQTGKYKYKEITQNGNRKETMIIEQVSK